MNILKLIKHLNYRRHNWHPVRIQQVTKLTGPKSSTALLTLYQKKGSLSARWKKPSCSQCPCLQSLFKFASQCNLTGALQSIRKSGRTSWAEIEPNKIRLALLPAKIKNKPLRGRDGGGIHVTLLCNFSSSSAQFGISLQGEGVPDAPVATPVAPSMTTSGFVVYTCPA